MCLGFWDFFISLLLPFLAFLIIIVARFVKKKLKSFFLSCETSFFSGFIVKSLPFILLPQPQPRHLLWVLKSSLIKIACSLDPGS